MDTSATRTRTCTGTTDGRARERRLLSAAFAGDARAVGVLYDEHADSLCRLACFVLDSRLEADDVVVDVFVQACTSPGLLVGGAAEGALRLALARRTYEGCLRRRPPGAGAPVGAVATVCLFAGCSSREVAFILDVAPADVPLLLARDLQLLAGPSPGSSSPER